MSHELKTAWPSTTQLLRHFGLMADYEQYGNPDALTRGRRVHEACHLLADNQSLDAPEANPGDWEARHPECTPYINAYRKFLNEHSVTMLEYEREYKSRTYRFISHPDQIVMLDNFGIADLELKTGTMPKCCELQTAGQVMAIGRSMARFGLLLQADGNYKLYPYDSFRNFDDFRALVTTWWTIYAYAPNPEEVLHL